MSGRKVTELQGRNTVDLEDLTLIIDISTNAAVANKVTVGDFINSIGSQPVYNANKITGLNIDSNNRGHGRLLGYDSNTNSIRYFDVADLSVPTSSSSTSGTVKTDTNSSDPTVYLKSSVDNLLNDKLDESTFNIFTSSLTPESINAVNINSIGISNGIVPLNNNTKINDNYLSPNIVRQTDLTAGLQSITTASLGAVNLNQLEVPNGVATLNEFGKIKSSQLPESQSVSKASTSVSGVIKTNITEADPVVYTQASVDNLLNTKEDTIVTLPISKGGTGSTTVSGARNNLGAASLVDLQAHTSNVSNPHNVRLEQVSTNLLDELQLTAANNLSDLSNVIQARYNLGLGTAALNNTSEFANVNHIHNNATTASSGFMSGTDKTKLESIQNGATVNSFDEYLLDRVNHTGEQSIYTITGLESTLDNKANINHTHTANQITDFNEAAQDAIGNILTDSSSIDFVYNDAANTITASAIFGDSIGTVCQGNDFRLSDARQPLTHTHTTSDITSGIFDITRLPVAGSGVSNTTSVVRADDVRLSNSRTPTTHTHVSTDITDLVESVDDRVAALIIAGTGITKTYDDVNGTLTISSTATGSAIIVQDEGTNLTTAASSFNFTGGGVTATNSGNAVTVNIPTVDLSNYVDRTSNQTIAGNKTLSGITSITNNTNSTSNTTGGLTVAGGLGVGGNIFTSGRLQIQTADATNYGLLFSTSSTAFPRGIVNHQEGNNAAGSTFIFRKAKGTLTTPVSVANNDYVGAFGISAHDGTNYLINGGILFRVQGTVTTNSIPTDIYFCTGANGGGSSGFGTERLTIKSDGKVGINTITPGSQFHVNGGMAITSTSAATDPGAGNLNVSGRAEAGNYKVSNLNTPPPSSTSTGTVGEIRYTADYIYLCINNNTWVRTPLSTW